MGRPRKFSNGDVAIHKMEAGFEVVVDYQQDPKGRGQYRCIRLTNPNNGYLHGPARWVDSFNLSSTPRTYKRGPSMYRNNQVIGDRGCRCNCCIHTAMPASIVKADGTYVGDEE